MVPQSKYHPLSQCGNTFLSLDYWGQKTMAYVHTANFIKKVYLVNGDNGTVSMFVWNGTCIDNMCPCTHKSIRVGQHPGDIAINPVTHIVYVTHPEYRLRDKGFYR